MQDTAVTLIQRQPDMAHLATFATRLLDWLVADLNEADPTRSREPVAAFTESRAKALLRAADLVDDPTRQDFEQLMTKDSAVRIALADLLSDSELADDDEVKALAATSAVSGETTSATVSWQPLAIAAYAWKRQYPLYQLDPAAPPDAHSPAGQVLKRAAYWMRQQVQRSATERDKLSRKLAFSAEAHTDSAQTLESMPDAPPIAPVPPHFRPPIPVRYPEVARDTLEVAPDEPALPTPTVERGTPISITLDDLDSGSAEGNANQPVRQPQITITSDQVQPRSRPQPTANVSTSATTSVSGSSFSDSIRRTFGRNRPPMKSTKLHVVVQEYPDGPGLYGLQVKVWCKGIKSYVAGTTNRDGKFVCELPVPQDAGLTYDIDVTWPREMNSEVERKSMTLNADRTQFTLPFYRQISEG